MTAEEMTDEAKLREWYTLRDAFEFWVRPYLTRLEEQRKNT